MNPWMHHRIFFSLTLYAPIKHYNTSVQHCKLIKFSPKKAVFFLIRNLLFQLFGKIEKTKPEILFSFSNERMDCWWDKTFVFLLTSIDLTAKATCAVFLCTYSVSGSESWQQRQYFRLLLHPEIPVAPIFLLARPLNGRVCLCLCQRPHPVQLRP